MRIEGHCYANTFSHDRAWFDNVGLSFAGDWRDEAEEHLPD
jgi:hypothetical protein